MNRRAFKYFCTIPVALLTLQACNITQNANQSQSIWVAPKQVNCQDVAPTTCYQILKAGPQAQWQLYHGEIDGFIGDGSHFQKLEASTISRDAPAADQSAEYLRVNKVTSLQKAVMLPNTSLLKSRKWTLKSLATFDGLQSIEHDSVPFITLSEQGISGFSGCNRFFGQDVTLYEAKNAKQSLLKVGNMATTRMMCHPRQTQELEQLLLASLNNSDRLLVQWPFLTFYHGDVSTAKFVASDWD